MATFASAHARAPRTTAGLGAGKGRKEGGKGGGGGREEREVPKQDSVEGLRRVGADIIVLQMALIGQFAMLGGTGRKHVFPDGHVCLCCESVFNLVMKLVYCLLGSN